MKARLLQHLETTGYFMAALGLLLLTVQLAGYWRFGSFDPFFYQATLPGTWQQIACLCYLCLTVILLNCKE